jgi:beta-N-acetylhexosaminidase
MKKLRLSLVIFVGLFSPFAFAQKVESFTETLEKPHQWADAAYKKLSRKHKIAQLFMVRAHSNLGKKYADSVAKVIRKEQLGGVVFFQGGPVRQALISNQYQALVKVPLMIAMDAEWGLGMRLDSTISYPYQMTLGAIQDQSLIYKMGQQVAKDFNRLGMQINFAPVMDINNNPKNPVINYRSFGDQKNNVAQKGIAYMQGMQDGGVFTTAKHFPGHGDTDVDSHFDLPQLSFSSTRLDTLEIFPFKQAFSAGLNGVMVAHMSIPALDATPHIPSTLSKPIVTEILKNKLGFKGLVFSDAMGMKGVVKYFPNGQADVMGIIAGNDVLELSENSGRAIKLIRKAIRHKQISWADINQRVHKILVAKYWMGLNQLKAVDTTQLIADLNQPEAQKLVQTLADAAITVLQGAEYLPLKTDIQTAIISVGVNATSTFASDIQKVNPNITILNVPKNSTAADLAKISNTLKNYPQIIVDIHDGRKRPASTIDFSPEIQQFISQTSSISTLNVVFANPYTLSGISGVTKSKSLMMGYQNTTEMEHAAAKVLLGNLKATGKLPVTINGLFKTGEGINME